ncbi:DUF2332 domain-containing protein [Crossiella sp. SN42]|uniref:DUF2332 domain-containing protein n=1 Tax=Crossiella sp. SN42 TaxID=2944808 RepID=UPI00207D3A98|nr:DUF2332 domain-containing protein [Crossiella sp. SN42]MCO1581238.1 DUF2332 domain-containing protein [Crossiella sp. SN42]
MTLTVEQVRAGCEWQRELCAKNDAPTYVALIDELVRRLGRDETVTELVTAGEEDPVRSALCLRLFGAVNRIAMAESAGWLDACYPIRGGVTDVRAVVPAFFAFMADHLELVRDQMKAGVQTNDVSRAAPLSAAMNHVALATGLPLRLLEVGSSAGLNLWLDKYFVEGVTRSWGPRDSPLRLTGQFESGDPRAAVLDIVERRGCDLNPIDVHADGAADLLRSFVWPEHVERARRLEAALRVARSSPPLTIDASSATPWVTAHAASLPEGVATVVYHSIVFPYFHPDERGRFAAAIRAAGELAEESRPLAWVSLEPSAEDPSVVELICQTWPDNRRVRLARTTPHGTRVRWEPADQASGLAR